MAEAAVKNSTVVRQNRAPWRLRAAFRLGAAIAPQATSRRALDLFSTPMRSSRTRAEAAPTLDARLDRLRIGKHRIALYHWGDHEREPVILISHGWSSFGLRFSPWVSALRAQGFAVVAFDQPGHGRNEASRVTLLSFVDTAVAVGRHVGAFAGAVGHSLGGAAIAAGMSEGLLVKRAVLIAPAADAVAASRRFSRAIALPEHRRTAMQAQLERDSGRSMDSFSVQHIAPRLSQPALIVHDLIDSDVPWEEGERYARFWPDARLLTTNGLGHHRIVNDPSVVAAGIGFLRGEVLGSRVVSTQQLVYGLA